MRGKALTAGSLALAVSGALCLATATPAFAAAGDASARGVVVDLAATVLDNPVITGDVTIGSADAPAAGGTDSSTAVDVDLAGALALTGAGTVEEVTASRDLAASSAGATVAGLDLSVLGVEVVSLSRATAEVSCPLAGVQTAGTTLADLEVFGEAATLVVNGPALTSQADVTAQGLAGATLQVELTRTESVTADGAAATAILARITLSGTVDDVLTVIPVGTVVIAQAVCERPAAVVADGIDPGSGPQSGGQQVTITGSGFVVDGTTVTFDGEPATDVVVADDGLSLTAVTPAGLVGPAEVLVSTATGTPDALSYTYLPDGSAATVTDLSPGAGPTTGGTVVTITGTGLTGATGVRFGGTLGTGFQVNQAGTEITVVTPPHAAGSAPAVVVFPAGGAAAGPFVYIPPTITAINPAAGPTSGGTTVTITGTGLSRATAVTFDGRAGTNLVVDPDGTSLTVTAPRGTPGTADVAVVLPGPDAVARAGFRYRLAAPTVVSVDPDQGQVTGGTRVTVEGSGFVPGRTSVAICGKVIAAGDVSVAPDGLSLTFVAPSCDSGIDGFTITTPLGTTDSVPFAYVNAAGLPITGSATATTMLLGAALLALGVLLVLAARRRRHGLGLA